MPAMTTALLRAELDSDPKALGYAALRAQTNAPEALAARLNEPGASVETIFATYTPLEDILAAIVRAEFDALTAANKAAADQFLRGTRVRTGDANMRATIGGLFGAGTTSRANLLALTSRPASRAQALWGEYAVVTALDVATALES